VVKTEIDNLKFILFSEVNPQPPDLVQAEIVKYHRACKPVQLQQAHDLLHRWQGTGLRGQGGGGAFEQALPLLWMVAGGTGSHRATTEAAAGE